MAQMTMPTRGAGPAFDIERARRDTPGAELVAHLNNAGAALPPSRSRRQ